MARKRITRSTIQRRKMEVEKCHGRVALRQNRRPEIGRQIWERLVGDESPEGKLPERALDVTECQVASRRKGDSHIIGHPH
jgi:hypothetical protein